MGCQAGTTDRPPGDGRSTQRQCEMTKVAASAAEPRRAALYVAVPSRIPTLGETETRGEGRRETRQKERKETKERKGE